MVEVQDEWWLSRCFVSEYLCPFPAPFLRQHRMNHKPIIAITAGDVSGIGPEVIVRALSDPEVNNACRPLVFCSSQVLQQAIQLCGVSGIFPPLIPAAQQPADRPSLEAIWSSAPDAIVQFDPQIPATSLPQNGTVNAAAGEAAFRCLLSAIDLAKAGIVDAIATAPLNKAALHAAGHDFPGHTEILADQCGVDDFAMMLHLSESRIAPFRSLVSQTAVDAVTTESGLSIAHVTLHTSVESVPQLLTVEGIGEKIVLMHQFLERIGCRRKAIAVCALNPHGGEQGLFGIEESTVIEPAIRAAATKNVNVVGPLPVDTLIRRAVMGEFDGVVAMYHDQGHIPIKLIGFDSAVNITLGLPIIRTSPTHGTAFDRAWNPATPADEAGMKEAILTAVKLSQGNA